MAGQRRAARRRDKRWKPSTERLVASRLTRATASDDTLQTSRKWASSKSTGDCDSDSIDDWTRAATVPLPSLENGDRVYDFVLETRKQRTSKRADVAQDVVDQRKKRCREEKAEKIVWRKFDRENRLFEQYYERCLGLKKEEFARFLTCLGEPVPVYVRVNGNYRSLSEIVTGTLEMDFNLETVTIPMPVGGGGMHVQFGPVSWVPEKRLWKLSVDSKTLRKVESLQSLRTYMRAQGSVGTLLQQDPAATVLPAFLYVQPGQRVLDLCGGGEHRAPIVAEYLRSVSSGSAVGASASASSASLLVVNERDATAAASAVRNVTRTLPLVRELVVTAHKPEEFPIPKAIDGLFDRVMCCAPCSGDGLARKLPEKWRTWNPEQALTHHPSQVGLAEHALALVRTGGMLLYSTRSLNPIEDEAVVAELLRRSNGALELVKTDDVLTGLERSHGLTKWDVPGVATWDDVHEDQRHRYRPSMWAPTPEECDGLYLDRCVRVLPHQNNTHGFFLAVIRKLRGTNTVSAAMGPAPLPRSAKVTTVHKNKKQARAEKPFGSFTTLDKQHLSRVQSFFGLGNNVTFLERTGIACQKRAVHVVTPAVSKLLTDQFRGRLSIYHAGVLALRPGTGTDIVLDELTDDGARVLLPEMKCRVLSLPLDEFSSFMESREMWLKDAGKHAREQLAEMTEGSLIVALDDSEPAQTGDRDIVLVAMKRHNSCSIVSTPAAIACVKALLEELNDAGGEDGYDSLEEACGR